MKISQEAREAANNLWQEMQDMGPVRTCAQGRGLADLLLSHMQSLINSTLERAATAAQGIYCDGDWLDRDHAANACAIAIRQLIEE